MRKDQNLQSIYPLTPLQQGMLFHYIKDKTSKAYFQQDELHLSGELDLALFEHSLQMLVQRYDILRTNFVYQKIQTPRQVVFKEKTQKVHFQDLSEMPEVLRDSFLKNFKEEDKEKGFDLTRENLMRVAVFKTAKENYKIIWSHHHIIMDGWCRGIVFKDFFTIYGSLKLKKPLPLSQVYPYNNYLEWLKKQDLNEAKEYWRKYLAGYQQRVYPPGYKKTTQNSPEFLVDEQVLRIDAGLTSKIEELARKLKVTVNAIFEAVWGILLQRYNHTQDVVFGSVVSGRSPEVEGIETMVGLFINTVPVRVNCSREQSFAEVVRQIHEAGVESRGYDYLSLAEIQSESLKGAIINNIMVFENFPTGLNLDESVRREIGFEVKGLEHSGHTNYDFNLRVTVEDEIRVDFTYNRQVYDQDYIELIKGHMFTLLQSISEDDTAVIKDLDIFPEKAELLTEFNVPLKIEHVMDHAFQSRFYQMVDRYPDKVVMEIGSQKITYTQLDTCSNQIANFLLDKGLRGKVIGVLTGKRDQVVTGILGIIKAGAIFVPFDPSYPVKRLQAMVEIAEPDLILADHTNAALAQELSVTPAKRAVVHILEEIIWNDFQRPDLIPHPDDKAYIYFTSGSTGRPKGIVGRYESLVQVIRWEIERLGFTYTDRFSQLTSPSFDPYLRDILPPLCVGGTICIPERDDLILDAEKFVKWVDTSRISVMHCIPSLFKVLNLSALHSDLMKELRYVCLAGERINPKMLTNWYSIFNNRVQLVNLYGPTETTLFKTCYPIQIPDVNKREIPLGKPMDGTKLIILDEDGKVCGRGVIGEIYIRTAYGTHGYLNHPDLEMQRFIVNPFSAGQKERLYRTGDLGRLLPDGNYEYAGRADHQVKIRGVRIELHDIESQLISHELVKEAVVIAREDETGEKFLCAFLEVKDSDLLTNGTDLKIRGLRDYLKTRLPEYMIPAYFVVMDKLPLSPNGKIDRNTLPDHTTSLLREREYVPPTDEVEQSLVNIYSELLGVDQIGILDDFFDLGGHSLKVMELLPRIYKEFGVELTVLDVINNASIQKLAQTITMVKTYGLTTFTKPYTLFNEKRAEKLFCFPPRSGMGVVYKGLAEVLQTHSIIGFDFIDTENYLEQYIKLIVELQPVGPYVFLGHSIGGSLAFEIAKVMQERGHQISKIIMFDTMKYVEPVDLTEERLEQEVANFFAVIDQQGSYIRDFIQLENVRAEMESKVRGYTRFKYQTVNSGQVRAEIHYVRAEESNRSGWEVSTSGGYFDYAGFGSHSLMLAGDNLSKNVSILKKIMTSL